MSRQTIASSAAALVVSSAFCHPSLSALTTRLLGPAPASTAPSCSCQSGSHAMPVDAVLVRPRMPHHESAPQAPVLLLPSATLHDPGCNASMLYSGAGSTTASLYGGGFHAPPVSMASDQSATASPTVQCLPAAMDGGSVCCCPHCGVLFAALSCHSTRPPQSSYVIHSFSPTLTPCYSLTVSRAPAYNVVQSPDRAYQPTASSVRSSRPATAVSSVSSSPHPGSPSLGGPGSPGVPGSLPLGAPGVRVRSTRPPPPSCANCGRIGHIQLDCTEPTINSVLNTRQYSVFHYRRTKLHS